MDQWQTLVDALRSELGQYGELRSSFDAQRAAIFLQDFSQLDRISTQIDTQIQKAAHAKLRREALVQNFIAEFAVGSDQTDFINLFPLSARGLLTALMEEVDSMGRTLQLCASQNQGLLYRLWERVNGSLSAVSPARTERIYASRAAQALNLKAEKAA